MVARNPCDEAEALSVSVEAAGLRQLPLDPGICDPVPERLLADVRERRVAEVVEYGGGLDEVWVELLLGCWQEPNLVRLLYPLLGARGVAGGDCAAIDTLGQPPRNLGDLEGVRETGAKELRLAGRRDLGLGLQAPERRSVDQPV